MNNPENRVARVGHYRWVICALLFFATAINYIDRQVFSILAPKLQEVIGWSEIEYGYIVFAFHVAYAARPCGRGEPHGSARHAEGLLAGDHFLEPRLNGTRLCPFRRGIWSCALCSRAGRGRQLPRRGENDRGMVSEKGTRAGDRHLQLRLQRRRNRRPVLRSFHRGELGLALGLYHHGGAGIHLAGSG